MLSCYFLAHFCSVCRFPFHLETFRPLISVRWCAGLRWSRALSGSDFWCSDTPLAVRWCGYFGSSCPFYHTLISVLFDDGRHPCTLTMRRLSRTMGSLDGQVTYSSPWNFKQMDLFSLTVLTYGGWQAMCEICSDPKLGIWFENNWWD